MPRFYIILFFIYLITTSVALGQNNPPIWDPVNDTTILEGQTLTLNLQANDDDLLDNLVITYLAVPGDSSDVTFTDVGGGSATFVYTPGYDAENDSVHIFTFVVTDGTDDDSLTVNITVVDFDPLPEIDPIPDTSVVEGDTLELDITALDPDGSDIDILILGDDLEPNMTFFPSGSPGPGEAQITFRFIPEFYQAGIYKIRVYATPFLQPNNRLDSAEFTVTVIEAGNQPPEIFAEIDTLITLEGEIDTLLITAADPDSTVPHISFVAPLIDNAVFVDSGNGAATVFFSPDAAQIGDTGTITFIAIDSTEIGAILEDSIDVTFVVIGPNLPPELTPLQDDTVYADEPLAPFFVIAIDSLSKSVVITADPVPNSNFDFQGQSAEATYRGIFNFTPDTTQIGDISVGFYASDGNSADTVFKNITVLPPRNKPPRFDFPPADTTFTVIELDSLIVPIGATDPESDSVEFSIVDDTLASDTLIYTGRDTTQYQAAYIFVPTQEQAGNYQIQIQAVDFPDVIDDQRDTTLTFNIVVEELNPAPTFTAPDSTSFSVNELQQLEIIFAASDPRDDIITFSIVDDTLAIDTLINLGNDSARYTISPGVTDGDVYSITILASDSASNDIDIQQVQLTVTITVIDINPPPVIDDIMSWVVNEGTTIIDTITASPAGPDRQIPELSIEPPAAGIGDGIGSYFFRDQGDGSALFDYTPGFALTDGTTTTLKFFVTARDSFSDTTVSFNVTVSNIPKNINDIGEADSVVLETDGWWAGDDILALRCRIWNDSIVTGGLTGFSWSDPDLECDSIVYGSLLDSAQYRNSFIFNDSLLFSVEFLFFDSMGIAPSGGEYFTAFFHHLNPAQWKRGNTVYFDSSKVGNNGAFVLDNKLRATMPGLLPDVRAFFNKAPNTYPPFMINEQVRAAFDSSSVAVYDVNDGVYLSPEDTIYTGINADGQPYRYQLHIRLENPETLSDVSLGLVLSSTDGVTLDWEAQAGDGLGASEAVTVLPFSRLTSSLDMWNISGGLAVVEQGVGGSLDDTVIVSGQADGADNSGFPPGELEASIALHILPSSAIDGSERTLCIDTLTGSWSLTPLDDTARSIPFSGGICYPVVYRNLVGTDEDDLPLPGQYSLDQNYPNPFNPATTISFTLPRASSVRLEIFNIIGQNVRVLADDYYAAGEHTIVWDGRSSSGKPVATGLYLYRLIADDFVQTKKMLLLK